MKEAVGIDYERYRKTPLVFGYERMMEEVGYSTDEVQKIQKDTGVGNTPLLELKNITKLARVISPPGKGARSYLKDEACNPSGSYKARRASMAVYHAKENNIEVINADPDPKDNIPGEKIVIPQRPEQLKYTELSLDKLKKTYLKNVIKVSDGDYFDKNTIEFLAEDTKLTPEKVETFLQDVSQESKINN